MKSTRGDTTPSHLTHKGAKCFSLPQFWLMAYVLRKRLKNQVLPEIVLFINDENVPSFPRNLYSQNQIFSPNCI